MEKIEKESWKDVTCLSPAKLNLCLRVAAPREDGYHPLYSIFQEISFSDELKMTLKDDGLATLTLSCSDSNCPINESNTIVKADTLLRQRYPEQFTQSVDLSLEKNIPMGSGLGGGSSNAASYLKAMNERAELELSTEELKQLGSEIGADVPFFIEGGHCLGRGNR